MTLSHGRIDVTDASALAEKRDVIWRTGPPQRAPALAEPFFSLRGIVEAVGQNVRQARRAGLAADVLDETRTPWWDGCFPPARVTGPFNVVTGLDGLRFQPPQPSAPDDPFSATGVDASRGRDALADLELRQRSGRTPPLPCPDNLRRIEKTARWLVRLATTLQHSAFWWLERREEVPYISLDLLGIAVDLAPSAVAMAIANNPQSGLALAEITPQYALLPRVWVRVTATDFDRDQPEQTSAELADELADILSVMKAPPTWTNAALDGLYSGEGGPLLAPTGEDQAALELTGQLIGGLMELLGEIAGLRAAEGFTRSDPLPKELVLDLLAYLSQPGVLDLQRRRRDQQRQLAEVAVDVFTRSLASQDPGIARPALLLFGQLVGAADESGPLLEWARHTLVPEERDYDQEQVGVAIMLTWLAPLEPLLATAADVQSELSRPWPLDEEHIRDGIIRAGEQMFGREIIGNADRFLKTSEQARREWLLSCWVGARSKWTSLMLDSGSPGSAPALVAPWPRSRARDPRRRRTPVEIGNPERTAPITRSVERPISDGGPSARVPRFCRRGERGETVATPAGRAAPRP